MALHKCEGGSIVQLQSIWLSQNIDRPGSCLLIITHVLLNKAFHFLEFSFPIGKITGPHVVNFKF